MKSFISRCLPLLLVSLLTSTAFNVAHAADDEQQHGEGACTDARHRFEERPQVGEERELAHEEEAHSEHAERYHSVLEQPEDVARARRLGVDARRAGRWSAA